MCVCGLSVGPLTVGLVGRGFGHFPDEVESQTKESRGVGEDQPPLQVGVGGGGSEGPGRRGCTTLSGEGGPAGFSDVSLTSN